MPTTHPVPVRNGLCSFVTEQIDGGNLVLYRADGLTEVATLPLSATAFAAPANGVALANAISDDTDATGGTATIAKLHASNSDEIVAGSVGTGSGDVSLSDNVILPGANVEITALTYAAPV